MKTNKIINILFFSCLLIMLAGCSKVDNLDEKFSPEILYKRLVMGTGGSESWQVSPDAMEVTLENGVTEWTIRARVSAPNGLKDIQLVKVAGGEELLQQYTDFTNNPNVYELNYSLSGITSQTTVRIRAVDQIGNQTVRDFVVKVQ